MDLTEPFEIGANYSCQFTLYMISQLPTISIVQRRPVLLVFVPRQNYVSLDWRKVWGAENWQTRREKETFMLEVGSMAEITNQNKAKYETKFSSGHSQRHQKPVVI